VTQLTTSPPATDPDRRAWSVTSLARRLAARAAAHPVITTTVVAAVLQLIWWAFLANNGGDIAAQDEWADFARQHPGRPYDFAHYGGIHQVSYSVMSPYIMAVLGVRVTMMLAATASAALLALLLARSPVVRRPQWPALAGAVALFGNSISGRTTFVIGMAFGLGALATVFAWPQRWRQAQGWHRWARGGLAAILAMLATFGSPVDGLFLGLVAAALWLQGRRTAAYALGVPPVLVVLLSKLFFPLSGVQPMHWPSVILPTLMAIFAFVTAPRRWRSLRVTPVVYVVAVLFAWLVKTPIGTNVNRLGLIFGGVALTAVLVSGRARSPFPRRLRLRRRAVVVPVALFASLALATSGIWQAATAAWDLVRTTPAPAWEVDTTPVIDQLRRLGAGTTRVEVVPTASHREVAALSQFVQARGWTRQLDTQLNARFYDQQDPITAVEYRRWLHGWAVSYVVVPPGRPDNGSITENALIANGVPYLHLVWHDTNWKVYAVRHPSPTVSGGASVLAWDEGGIRMRVPRAGRYLIKEKYSRHMLLVDRQGQPVDSPETMALNQNGCVLELQPAPSDSGSGRVSDGGDSAAQQTEQALRYGWTVLQAPSAGVYRLTSDYTHDTSCPPT
jgi:MFS family permease